MENQNTKINNYLQRINYNKPPVLSRETLDELQACHYESVPYENFDILDNKPLSLEIDDLYEKIVVKNRGGYCFELNELYGWLLKSLGYTVCDYLSRFLYKEPSIPMRRHHVLVAEVDGERLLCDVGVGAEAPRKTLLLQEEIIQEDGLRLYKTEKDDELGWVLSVHYKDEWKRLY